jgi:hypothetical protein
LAANVLLPDPVAPISTTSEKSGIVMFRLSGGLTV